jgi:type III secretory pathway component EscR
MNIFINNVKFTLNMGKGVKTEITEIEKVKRAIIKIKEIRKKRNKLKEEIKQYTDFLHKHMQDKKVRYLKVDDCMVERQPAYDRKVKWYIIEKAIEEGLIEQEAFKKSVYYRILISTKDDFKLKGNQWN